MKEILLTLSIIFAFSTHAAEGNTRVVGSVNVTEKGQSLRTTETGLATPGSGMQKSMGYSR